jgi:hypothetical protein
MMAGSTPEAVDFNLSGKGVFDPYGNMNKYFGFWDMHFISNVSAYLPTANDISSLLGANKYILVHVDKTSGTGAYQQHYVLIAGSSINPASNKCDFAIQDPGSHQNKWLSAYTNNGWELLEATQYYFYIL